MTATLTTPDRTVDRLPVSPSGAAARPLTAQPSDRPGALSRWADRSPSSAAAVELVEDGPETLRAWARHRLVTLLLFACGVSVGVIFYIQITSLDMSAAATADGTVHVPYTKVGQIFGLIAVPAIVAYNIITSRWEAGRNAAAALVPLVTSTAVFVAGIAFGMTAQAQADVIDTGIEQNSAAECVSLH